MCCITGQRIGVHELQRGLPEWKGHLGVPVTVKDDDCVGGGKIYTQTPRTRRQQERKVSGPRRVEMLHCLHHCHFVKAIDQGTPHTAKKVWGGEPCYYRCTVCFRSRLPFLHRVPLPKRDCSRLNLSVPILRKRPTANMETESKIVEGGVKERFRSFEGGR